MRKSPCDVTTTGSASGATSGARALTLSQAGPVWSDPGRRPAGPEHGPEQDHLQNTGQLSMWRLTSTSYKGSR